ncbi:MAG: hypothetical protein ACOC5T_00390 [Elusimicrobiota bacterium]
MGKDNSNNTSPYNNLIARSEYETYKEMERDQRLDDGGTPNSIFKGEKKYYPGSAPDVRDDSLGEFRDLGKPKDEEEYFTSVQLPRRFGEKDCVTVFVQSNLFAFISVVFLIVGCLVKAYIDSKKDRR